MGLKLSPDYLPYMVRVSRVWRMGVEGVVMEWRGLWWRLGDVVGIFNAPTRQWSTFHSSCKFPRPPFHLHGGVTWLYVLTTVDDYFTTHPLYVRMAVYAFPGTQPQTKAGNSVPLRQALSSHLIGWLGKGLLCPDTWLAGLGIAQYQTFPEISSSVATLETQSWPYKTWWCLT